MREPTGGRKQPERAEGAGLASVRHGVRTCGGVGALGTSVGRRALGRCRSCAGQASALALAWVSLVFTFRLVSCCLARDLSSAATRPAITRNSTIGIPTK